MILFEAISVNCTFDDPFLCGYTVEGFSWEYGNNQSEFRTFIPSSDTTIGRWPGTLFYTRFINLHVPRQK